MCSLISLQLDFTAMLDILHFHQMHIEDSMYYRAQQLASWISQSQMSIPPRGNCFPFLLILAHQLDPVSCISISGPNPQVKFKPVNLPSQQTV